MKNKKLTVFLFIGVALVWGFAIFQLLVNFSGNEPAEKKDHKIVLSQSLLLKEDTFQLVLKYRDPFRIKSVRTPSASIRRVPVKPVVPSKPPEEKKPEIIDWSFVRFIGLISNRDKNKSVALVSLHGKEKMVSEGDSIGEVHFLKYFPDSILISKGINKTYISRK